MPVVYQKMAEALQKAGRPIVYSLCQYGRYNVQEWGPAVSGHLWRTTMDIRDQWESMANIGFSQSDLAPFAGPGHWNDPDMLEIGNGRMTPAEYRTHFTLWSMLASPLIAGNDIRSMAPEIREILTNREVIAIDQDPLGKAAQRITKDGAHAVALFNRGDADREISVTWNHLKLPGSMRVRDLWAREDRGQIDRKFSVTVPPHGVVLLRLAN
jgi:alpha-galactosidase